MFGTAGQYNNTSIEGSIDIEFNNHLFVSNGLIGTICHDVNFVFFT